MSQPSRRRAAFGAAVLGVLLALTSSLGIAAPAGATATDVASATSSPASYASGSHALDNAVRTAHSSALGSAASHRTHGGIGSAPAAVSAVALLLLAGLCVLVAVRRTHDGSSWRSAGAAGPRAPPVFC